MVKKIAPIVLISTPFMNENTLKKKKKWEKLRVTINQKKKKKNIPTYLPDKILLLIKYDKRWKSP